MALEYSGVLKNVQERMRIYFANAFHTMKPDLLTVYLEFTIENGLYAARFLCFFFLQ